MLTAGGRQNWKGYTLSQPAKERVATRPLLLLLSVAMAPALAIVMGIDLRIRGAEQVLVHGIADEIAHLLTATIMLSAVWALGLRVNWFVVALGAVLPDIEYITRYLDVAEGFGDGSRGIMHTLVPGAVLAALGLLVWPVWRPLRVLLISLGLALLTHVVRDSATSAIPLLWPLQEQPFHLRYSVFLAILAVCATITTGSVALALAKVMRIC